MWGVVAFITTYTRSSSGGISGTASAIIYVFIVMVEG